jgi:hypothetical protein
MKKESSNKPEKAGSAKQKRAHSKRNWKKIAIRTSFVMVVLVGIIGNVPMTYETTEVNSLAYGTQYKDESGIELGEERTSQEGAAGKQAVTYKNKQSIFDYLLGRKNAKKEVVNSSVQEKPTDKVVLKGARKWQYMMCSNGRYRYFTDEQFKDPNTGFTSKSPDYCEQYNEGKKIGLADSPNGTNNGLKFTNVPSSCTRFEIPYKTVYEDAGWLDIGQTSEGTGFNGFKYVCTGGTADIVVNPINKKVYRGTAQRSPSVPSIPSTPRPDYQAKAKCEADYASAKSQLQMSGAANSSVMEQINQLHRQCLSRAGF